ncbi:MAG: hypothetical protein GF383_03525 [Candidatus Lokiarchaeota archaeon]|nr:hypothetical protein [Candidatus Lokiarchaeota archaeon]MBD3338716.1 hypothetical protein [Candidatus Lokiarchaeota archaeon]
MPFIKIQSEDIYFSPNVQEMCVTTSFTCPNYNKSWSCPPVAPYMEKETLKYNEFYLVYSKFDLESYVKETKAKHPKRSEQKIKNRFYMKYIYQNDLDVEINKLFEQYKSAYEQKLVLYDGSCRICMIKKVGNCTYESGEPCRYPDEMRYSMEAVGIEVIKTVLNLKADIEYPSNKYTYRFGLACFK